MNKQHILARSSFKAIILRFLKSNGDVDEHVYDVINDYLIIKEAKDLEESGKYKHVHAFENIFSRLELDYAFFGNPIYNELYKLYQDLIFKEFEKNVLTSKEYISVLEKYKLNTSYLDTILDKIHRKYVDDGEDNITYLLLKKITIISENISYDDFVSCYYELLNIERKHLNNCAYYE